MGHVDFLYVDRQPRRRKNESNLFFLEVVAGYGQACPDMSKGE